MKKKRLLSMLLAATLLFSLTACARTDNGEEPSDEQPSQGTTSQAPADPMEVSQGVTDDTIKIGTISLVSGAFAYIGQPAYDGLRACIERFNAQGGVQLWPMTTSMTRPLARPSWSAWWSRTRCLP